MALRRNCGKPLSAQSVSLSSASRNESDAMTIDTRLPPVGRAVCDQRFRVEQSRFGHGAIPPRGYFFSSTIAADVLRHRGSE
jgi:hypothetical protein